MTIEMQDALNREPEDAKAINDADLRREAMETVHGHMLSALIDCQRKTSDRVKDLVARADVARQRLKGAQAMLAALRYLAAAGGGAALIRALGA